jgi:Flp pilus assembly protein TadD
VFPAKKRPFDRTEALAAADRARAKGKHRAAVAGYRRVLEAHPDDLGAHGKLAPLLARDGDRAAALASFRCAAGGHLAAGFQDRALAVLTQAVEHFPDEEPVWDEVVRIQLARGRRLDAVVALAKAGARLLGRGDVGAAERVLRRAGQIEPWHPEATLLLARALARGGRPTDAVRLLDGLATRTGGAQRAAARRLALRLAPGARTFWRWLSRR